MSDITATGASTYEVGGIDTATVLVNGVSPRRAEHVNGPASAAVQIEHILGSATSLKGAMADLATRLDVALNSNGTIKIGTGSVLSGILGVPNGGTGKSTVPDQKYMIGNGSTFDLLTPHGFIYSGPTSTGTGSTLAHEGTIIVSGPVTLDGLHFYTDFTLTSAGAITLGAATQRLIIVASNSITLAGSITATGKGSSGNSAAGFTQPGGGGGDGTSGTAGAGGAVLVHGVTRRTGAAGGSGGVGGTGTQITGVNASIAEPYSILGGASGGVGATSVGGPGGAGGAGGGSIVLVAPTIILASTAVLTTSGSAGAAGASQSGGGGGGGAGNIYIFCRLFTDNGCTYTMNAGGAGAGGGAGGFNGGPGAAGVKFIFLYGNS